jgi:hypothetical protein
MAGNLSLVIFSRELKQYGPEALLALAAAGACASLLRADTCERQCALGTLLIGVSIFCPLMGYGVLFPLVCLLPYSFFACVRRRGMHKFGAVFCLVAFSSLIASTLAVWAIATRAQAESPALKLFMTPWLIDPLQLSAWIRAGFYGCVWLVSSLASLNWLGVDLAGVATIAVGSLAIATLAFWGILSAPTGSRLFLSVWLLAPLLLMLAAACTGRYPFANYRMMQVAVPPLLLALASGAYTFMRMINARSRQARSIRIALTLALALIPSVASAIHVIGFRHYMFHDFRSVLRCLDQLRRPGEWVLADGTSAACVAYYAPTLAEPKDIVTVVAGTLPPPNDDFFFRSLSRIRNHTGRTWWLTTSEPTNQGRPAFEADLRKHGFHLKTECRGGAPDGTFSGAAELIEITRSH